MSLDPGLGQSIGSAAAAVPEQAHLLLRGAPQDAALIIDAQQISYADVSARVDSRVQELGATRRLVFLEVSNDVESVVTYLACLQAGHPVLLAAPGDAVKHPDLLDRYRPDVVQAKGEGVRELFPGSRHDLHPDLAVLLSTSGSTGSPRLVRLSRRNLTENAASIAQYLQLRPTDRGITTLPLNYCYGLSVLNSHLSVGAAVVLSDLSVADECFWTLMEKTGVTGFAGVPYTFELLEASNFADRELPSLRYLTQAGGRMEPGRVRAYAELGQRRGWDLYVMYGATEATARMAYLPPCLAAACPQAIGIPIPGGCFRLRHIDVGQIDIGEDCRSGVGELVYEGPNVMMGYAERPADLADGATLTELRTGDLARQGADGLWQIVGRINRIAKVFGLRIDLERIETALAAQGAPVRLVARPDQLWAFTDRPRQTETIRRGLGELTILPPSALRVVYLDRLPLTPSGKPDAVALEAHLDAIVAHEAEAVVQSVGFASPDTIRDLYAVILGRPDATTQDSFVDLGGDSLSYVEASSALAEILDSLPANWPQLAPSMLAEQPGQRTRARRRWGVPVDISVCLRALAITLIVVSHADIAQLQGGAHVLLAVMGYNLARFQLRRTGRRARVGSIARAAVAIAIPAALWILALTVMTGNYKWPTALFLNQALGSNLWGDDWQFWFLEALVWTYFGLAALLAVPWLDRWQRAHSFATAMVAMGVALALRYALVGVEAGPTERFTVVIVLWCVTAGWAAAVARAPWQRSLVAALIVFATVGFFGDTQRETIVILGILLLLIDRPVRLPRFMASVIHIIAVASLWIYLTQWQVYPGLEEAGHPYLAVLASLVVGIVAHRLYSAAATRLGRRYRGFRDTDVNAREGTHGNDGDVVSARPEAER